MSRPQYDVLVMVTYPEAPDRLMAQMGLLAAAAKQPRQRQLLVLHNPDHVLKWPMLSAAVVPHMVQHGGGSLTSGHEEQEGASTQGQEGSGAAARGGHRLLPTRMQPGALAPFVASYSRSLLETYAEARGGAVDPAVHTPWLPPLVPAQALDGGVPPAELRHLCIQVGWWGGWRCADRQLCVAWPARTAGPGRAPSGSLAPCCQPACPPTLSPSQGTVDPMRRDYAAAFDAAAHPAVLARLRANNESVLLVGTLRAGAPPLPVPTPLQPHVRTVANLNYQVGEGRERGGCAAGRQGWRHAGV